MTEDEAKTKWCPMVRAGDKGGSKMNCNRDTRDIWESWNLCIASNCMMWRRNILTPEELLGVQTQGDADIAKAYSKEGYCGLAGVPK